MDWRLSETASFEATGRILILWDDNRRGATQNDARAGGRTRAETHARHDSDLALSGRFAGRSMSIDARIEAFNAFDVTDCGESIGALPSVLFEIRESASPSGRIQLDAIVSC